MNLDNIGPSTRTVALGGAAVEVAGLSLRKLHQLLGVYPQLAGFLAGGRIDIAGVLAEGPDIAMAIFSLGVVGVARRRFWQQRRNQVIDDDLIVVFEMTAAGEQAEALASIFDLTFKGGERALPFLKRLVAPADVPTPTPDVPTPSESSPQPSSD